MINIGGFKMHVLQKDELPNVQQIFDEGVYVKGVNTELMLYLGTQLVHGDNYAYIARSQADYEDSIPYYELVIINYLNNNGNKIISLVRRETIVRGVPKGIVGGMMCSTEEEACIREYSNIKKFDELIDIFKKAIDKTKEMKEETEIVKKVKRFDYESKLYLGYAVSRGINYYYIAEATNIKTEQKSVQLLEINDFMDKSEILKIEDIL
ncbi:hypothetical protein [Brachyspira innocens]|uniref:hypothetical protein n=1 Tax=Brachyspira innocens TaxID=13264 RepID=UPI0026F1A218|nr:hypothetical protein [Brachyspira innocens]